MFHEKKLVQHIAGQGTGNKLHCNQYEAGREGRSYWRSVKRREQRLMRSHINELLSEGVDND